MTTNYKIGRNAEYKCMAELQENGYYTIRSAGSHGLFDVVGIDLNIIRLIQVKTTSTNSGNIFLRNKDVQDFINLSVPKNCRKELWLWRTKTKKWHKDVLTDYNGAG